MPNTVSRRPYQLRSTQIAEYLRERLQAGEWAGQLPGERVLAEQAGVSRRTVRAALETLQQEGWVAERSRQGTQVARKRRRRGSSDARAGVRANAIGGGGGGSSGGRAASVGLLLPLEMEHLRHRTILWIDDLRRILYERGISMQVYHKQFAGNATALAYFRKLAASVRHDCWVLPYSSPAMQRWCVGQRLRAVIVGTLHEAGSLPHVDFNYRASCHHAATQMLRLGHRQLVFVLNRQERGGDIESRVGFLEGAGTAGGQDAVASVAHHDGTVADLCRLADRLLARSPRPTAWLIADPACFLTVQTHLLRQGIDVPGEVSLVCRDADPYLANCTPEPARYVFDIRSLAKSIARLVQKVAAGQSTLESTFVIPNLIPGQTLGVVETGAVISPPPRP